MTRPTRRDFLKQSAVATSAIVPYFLSSEQPVLAQSPSDRLRMGNIGLNGMGRADAHGFNGLVDIVALCDVDSQHLEFAKNDNNIGKKDSSGNKINLDTYKDYRRILERKDIDVVSIATPDHWHTKIAIEALQAGKHVFCEKPLTLTIEENQLVRAACKKYGKVFQVGTQQRSQRDQFLTAILMIQRGFLGDIQRLTCNVGGGGRSAPLPKADVPAALDYDMWLGQAPLADYVASKETNNAGRPVHSRVHGTFRYWYEYSGGTLTDWGAHHVDIAMWMIGELGPGKGPISVKPIVAEHAMPFKDGYPTEDNQFNTTFRFDIESTFASGTVMNVVSHSSDGNGILVEGTKGTMHVNRERIKGKPYEEIGGKLDDGGRSLPYARQPELQKVFSPEEFEKLYNGKKIEGHKQNFLSCIREGGLPVSDVYTHTQAMNVCHLCAIAARLGREVAWDPKTEKTGDALSQSFIAREQRKNYEISRS